MTRRPSSFRQSGVSRAVKVAQAAGLALGKVEVARDGTIRVIVASTPELSSANSFDHAFQRMRVRLKGINKVNKRLCDDSHVAYYHAWKGGPRLPGQPGDQYFMAAYNAALNTKTKAPEGILQSVLDAYQKSSKFTDLAVRTRKDYIKHIRLIETEFGDFPVEAIADRRARDTFPSWRDGMAIKSRRQADHAFSTLAAIMAWAADRGLIPCNPCEQPGKLYRADRTDSIWTKADEKAFLNTAPTRLSLADLLAV